MASQLAALTSITSLLAKAYYLIGKTYYSLPDPVPGLRNAFTVSPTRELPDLVTIFGMLEEELLRARASMQAGVEYAMVISLCVANELVKEAWFKVWWLDMALANGIQNDAHWEWYEDVDDDEEAFEKWRAVLPACCGVFIFLTELESIG